jgi:hypothetical protein
MENFASVKPGIQTPVPLKKKEKGIGMVYN